MYVHKRYTLYNFRNNNNEIKHYTMMPFSSNNISSRGRSTNHLRKVKEVYGGVCQRYVGESAEG